MFCFGESFENVDALLPMVDTPWVSIKDRKGCEYHYVAKTMDVAAIFLVPFLGPQQVSTKKEAAMLEVVGHVHGARLSRFSSGTPPPDPPVFGGENELNVTSKFVLEATWTLGGTGQQCLVSAEYGCWLACWLWRDAQLDS